jgi:protein SCO1/2
MLTEFLLASCLLLQTPIELKGVGVDERISSPIPQNISFKEEGGRKIVLRDLIGDGKPVILTLVYYNCPRVCNLILNSLATALNEIDLTAGSDFRIVTISFDPKETPEQAAETAQANRKILKRIEETGWYFLTGSRESIKTLTEAVGFKYKKINNKEFSHPTVIIVLSPEGRIARYLYGINFRSSDLKLSLLEAAKGKVGASTILNKVVLFCFRYDPVGKKYVFYAWNLIKLTGIISLTIVVVLIIYLLIADTKKYSKGQR